MQPFDGVERSLDPAQPDGGLLLGEVVTKQGREEVTPHVHIVQPCDQLRPRPFGWIGWQQGTLPLVCPL